MADQRVSAATAPSAPRQGRVFVALQVAVVYLLARLVTVAFFLAAAQLSGTSSRFGVAPTVGTLLMGWDAQWYWLVAEEGYPSDVPTDESGAVQQNAWAFMPVYPTIAKALATVWGGFYPPAAIIVTIVAGYLACLALYALLRPRLDAAATLTAVAMFTAGPLAAMFLVGYAEALFLLWLFLALLSVQRRTWWWLYPLVPLMGYTRPGVLPFALLLALYGIWRFARRERDPLPPREIGHIVALGLLAAAVGFSWPVIVGAVTGDPSAYFETELAWRRGWTGDTENGFVPFAGVLQAAAIWAPLWGWPVWLGYVVLAVVVGTFFALLLWHPLVRALGPVVRLWSASYVLYLLAVFFPQSSLFRLLLPLSPLYGALAAPRSLLWRGGVLAVGLIGQWWWIYNMYALGNTYTQIP
ncbi:hypothetical protein [Microbacterium sp.]|uniref:hypothetical protein n=1 Tax=Microbacterium sp. TaxID=51671 RepID=UPI003A8B49F5